MLEGTPIFTQSGIVDVTSGQLIVPVLPWPAELSDDELPNFSVAKVKVRRQIRTVMATAVHPSIRRLPILHGRSGRDIQCRTAGGRPLTWLPDSRSTTCDGYSRVPGTGGMCGGGEWS